MGGNNSITTGIKTMSPEDTQAIQQLQTQLFGAVKKIGKLGNYGLYGNAPEGSFVIVLQVNGQEEYLFGIEDDVNERPRGLKSGEVMLCNTAEKTYVYLKEGGDIDIYTPQNINMYCTKTTVHGNLFTNTLEVANGATGTFANSVTTVKGVVTAGS